MSKLIVTLTVMSLGGTTLWNDNSWLALLLTLFAGLSTGIGGAMALLSKKVNTRFLSLALGFSAGVMVYVSFMDILPKGQEALVKVHGPSAGSWMAIAAFFAGMAAIAIIDRVIPEDNNPHHPCPADQIDCPPEVPGEKGLQRMGILAALSIAIHNFPEGLATFAATLQDPQMGTAIAFAIAIHNLPEGIAVAVPIFYATKSRGKAFFYALLSGASEPVGALLGYLLLRPFFNDVILGLLFAFVAGIMVFISLDELLPTARAYAEEHLAIYGTMLGMAVMAISLLLFV